MTDTTARDENTRARYAASVEPSDDHGPASDDGPVSLTRPNEPIVRRVLVLGTAYAFLVLLQRSTEAMSLSLFLDHLGAKQLPLTYLAVSLVDVPLAFLYMKVASIADRRWLLVGMGALVVGAMATSRLVEVALPGWGMFLAYLLATSLGTFLVVHWGVLLLDGFTVGESRRAFPLVYAGGHVGSFVAGALMQLAGPWQALDLLVAIPGAAFLGLAVSLVSWNRIGEGAAIRKAPPPRPGLAAGVGAIQRIHLLRGSSLLRLIAFSTALMVVLRMCLRLLYGASFESAFATPESLTRFLGSYTMVASVAGVMFQLMATPKLLRWLGVGKLNLAYGGALLLSLVGLAGLPGLWSAAASRFTDNELKAAIKTPVSAMFYDALHTHQRADARAIILGIISPLASLCSSALLVSITRFHTPTEFVAWAAAVGGLGYVALSWAQARAYDRSLEDDLVSWARDQQGRPFATIHDAIELARSCEDQRIVDMAREVRRRRR